MEVGEGGFFEGCWQGWGFLGSGGGGASRGAVMGTLGVSARGFGRWGGGLGGRRGRGITRSDDGYFGGVCRGIWWWGGGWGGTERVGSGEGIGGGGIWAQVWGGEIVLFGCEFLCLDGCFWVF
jgi:hypothetical protein